MPIIAASKRPHFCHLMEAVTGYQWGKPLWLAERRPRGFAPQVQTDWLTVWRAKVSYGQLQVALAVVGVVLERERQVDGRAMLGDEALPLGRAPGDAAEDAALLPERHLEVPFLQAARPIDDFDAAGAEDGARVAGAERRQRRQFRHHLLVDRSERERAVDPQPRSQVVGTEAAIGEIVDARAQLANPRGLDRQPRRLLVAAELRHHLAARFERPQHVERRDAAARAVRHVAVDGNDDRRPMERVDQLRRDDADDPAVPAVAGDDEHGARPDL